LRGGFESTKGGSRESFGFYFLSRVITSELEGGGPERKVDCGGEEENWQPGGEFGSCVKEKEIIRSKFWNKKPTKAQKLGFWVNRGAIWVIGGGYLKKKRNEASDERGRKSCLAFALGEIGPGTRGRRAMLAKCSGLM